MSMENAILIHAAALEKLAEAIRSAYGSSVGLLATPLLDGVPGLVEEKAAELVGATTERAAMARDAKAKDAAANAELEQAVQNVEKAAKSGKTVTKAETKLPDDTAANVAEVKKQNAPASPVDEDAEPLDYVKDVRPVLLAAIKKAGKDKVQELVSSFGVDKADKIDPAKYGDLLAKAKKLAA